MKKILFIFTALCCCFFAVLAQAQRGTARYASLDWTVAETLLALGVEPVAIGDVEAYEKWVAKPSLPPKIIDLGLRHQPNLEQVAWLAKQDSEQPLIFINTPFYAMASATLKPFAQVEMVDFYQAGNAWQNIVTATQQVANLAGRTDDAEKLLANFDKHIAQLVPQALPFTSRPIALVQFIDTRHLRIYAENSLLGAVLNQLGFHNAWQGEYNIWGFATINITQLSQLPQNVRLVVIKPYPVNVVQALSHNSLWQHLKLNENTLVLPAIWTFGGIPSAQRFAQTLVQALQTGGEPW